MTGRSEPSDGSHETAMCAVCGQPLDGAEPIKLDEQAYVPSLMGKDWTWRHERCTRNRTALTLRVLFAGFAVRMSRVDADWQAELVDPTGMRYLALPFSELSQAFDVAHEWLFMCLDETPLSGKPDRPTFDTADQLREEIARYLAADSLVEPMGRDTIAEPDTLREWFEREMGR